MSAIGSVMVMRRPSEGASQRSEERTEGVAGLAGSWVRAFLAVVPRGACGEEKCYQLDLVTPGNCPACAISRTQIRQRPNVRKTARGRPHRWQRVYARTAYFGLRLALTTRAFFATPSSSSRSYDCACCPPRRLGPGARWPSSGGSVGAEGEPEPAEQLASLLVGTGGGHHGDVHAALPVHPVHVDLVEHRLLIETERVVAVAVELLGREPAEVPDARQRDAQQAVQELPHPVAAQRHLRADRHALTQLELRDGLAGPLHERLLAGDRGQVAHRAVHQLRVPGSLADTHVDDDLHHARDLHDVGVAELLAQAGGDLLVVARLQPRRRTGRGGHQNQISFPDRRAIRTLRPSESLRNPIRVGLPSESTTITLLTWMEASWVTMPPVWAPRWVVDTRVCFLIRLTPSTSTRCALG